MKPEFTITLQGVEYPVVAEGDTITVNGRPFVVEVADEGTVLIDGIAYPISLEDELVVFDKDTYAFEVSGLARAAVSSPTLTEPGTPLVEAGAGAILAIMPGKIVRVLVEPGQAVAEGEAVCVLEAMKMENELHARQDGTVSAVYVKPGDDVEKDQVLIEIE